MSIEVKVPPVGESVTEVQIGDWLRQSGDAVGQDEPIVSIETEKVSLDVPAPASGVVGRILKHKGQTATVGEVIGYVEETAQPKGRESTAPKQLPDQAGGRAPQQTAEPPVMPAARRLLHEHGLKAEEVSGTGKGGRVLKEDVLRHVEERVPTPEAAKRMVTPAREEDRRPRKTGMPIQAGDREEEVVPLSLLRRRVAERLVQAQQTAALLTTFNEIDMAAVTALRHSHQQAFQQRHGVKLGMMSFFVRAAIEALKLIPELNAEIRGSDLVYHHYYDIGIAVGSGRGLVVPVIRHAERLGFAEIERAIADFAQRAQTNELRLEELQGGTFTISNGGVYGSLLSTPIVNPPQSGILGLHVIQDRPVARDGQMVIRPMMYGALTYDHRIVDGREAVAFLKQIKTSIEDPARMLLEI